MKDREEVAKGQAALPKLRFSEFHEAWDLVCLGDVCGQPAYGMNAAAQTFDGKHKYIRITDISEDSREFCPSPLMSPEPPIAADYRLRLGDLVFARTGASTGKTYLYKEEDGELYFAGFLIRFPIVHAEPKFVFAQTLRSKFSKWIAVVSVRSGQPGVNALEYASFEFLKPSLPEQQKIAAFLSAVDEKIAQLTRKKALLEDYKKGCMQQLFSQKIRFKDDQGNDFPDWEEKRLGDVVHFGKGKGISKGDIKDGASLPCIRYGEIYTHYAEQIDVVHSRTNVPADELVLSNSGDVIVPASGEDRLDMARACCVMVDGVALGGDINILRGAENGLFLAYYLNNAKTRDIARFAQGYSVVHLYGSQLKPLSVLLPHPEEQKKIADFLSELDEKLATLSDQIRLAQTFKKGLLQQMFV
ncbi:restriction endonuclease subunit S [Ponticaulis sp.]|uniref:restriction endonuclease subunit S n=1 Tax=Ponticaulis sp. TaxID=2020902 RepID=UPI002628B93D|nr:restriction endonuclease subunit S [Ponticaulis sp.]MDF1680271.1 restriction endonuclease subunit S [Ponticaulis sp.]